MQYLREREQLPPIAALYFGHSEPAPTSQTKSPGRRLVRAVDVAGVDVGRDLVDLLPGGPDRYGHYQVVK